MTDRLTSALAAYDEAERKLRIAAWGEKRRARERFEAAARELLEADVESKRCERVEAA